MDRVHYRRVAPSRLNGEKSVESTRTKNEEPTSGENIILQSIVSGILIVFVLLITMMNTAPTSALRVALRDALSGAETAGELITEVRFLSEEYFGWGPSLETEPESFPFGQPINQPHFPSLTEEITTAADEVSNPQIPGSLVVPELWD